MTEMTVVKVRGGWAVSGGQPYYLTEPGTKKAAQEFIDRCARTRARLAAFEAAKQARIADLLAAQGIGVIDFRQLKPGDLFTWRPEVPPKAVTEVKHFDSGASLVFWEPDRHTSPAWAMTLMTPPFPAYGVLRPDDGTTACTDTSTPHVPHKPKEG